MENASKALLIAGGILLAMLVFSLLLFARNNVSDYYASQEEFKDIKDVTKFNKQFTNYERTDVKGYELISLINSVIDYNDRKSTQELNQDQGKPIDVIVNFNGKKDDFANIEVADANKLFKSNEVRTYGNSSTKTFKSILIAIDGAINEVGSKDDIAKISKHINGIFEIKETDPDKLPGLQENAVRLYNSYITTGSSYKVSNWTQLQNNKKNAVYQYYQYTYFKKAIFECTKVLYDDNTGKVYEMDFKYTGIVE